MITVVGRDDNGIIQTNFYTWEASCEIFRLYGHEILTGYWRLVYNKRQDDWTLYERFPDLSALDNDDDWNAYHLNKISSQIVANPEMSGYQCFLPSVEYPIGSPDSNQCWVSDLLSPEQLIAHQFFEGDEVGCWLFVTQEGYVIRGGYNYDFRQEWDGGLLLLRWDDQINDDTDQYGVYGCSRGSMFVVRTSQTETVFSYQCEDRITGDQYLTHLDDSERCDELECPLWTADRTRHKFMTTTNPTMYPTAIPTLEPTLEPLESAAPFVVPPGIPDGEDFDDGVGGIDNGGGVNGTNGFYTTDGGDEFASIAEALEQCTGSSAEELLEQFMEQHVTDTIIPLLEDAEWESLIPEIGFRICCKLTLRNLGILN